MGFGIWAVMEVDVMVFTWLPQFCRDSLPPSSGRRLRQVMLCQPTREGGITHVVMTKMMRRIDGATTGLSLSCASNICGPVASPVSAVT